MTTDERDNLSQQLEIWAASDPERFRFDWKKTFVWAVFAGLILLFLPYEFRECASGSLRIRIVMSVLCSFELAAAVTFPVAWALVMLTDDVYGCRPLRALLKKIGSAIPYAKLKP